MLPVSYIDAGVRNITPLCNERNRLGVAFDVPGQGPLRLALTADGARFLRDSLADYVNSLAGSQSCGSELAQQPTTPEATNV